MAEQRPIACRSTSHWSTACHLCECSGITAGRVDLQVVHSMLTVVCAECVWTVVCTCTRVSSSDERNPLLTALRCLHRSKINVRRRVHLAWPRTFIRSKSKYSAVPAWGRQRQRVPSGPLGEPRPQGGWPLGQLVTKRKQLWWQSQPVVDAGIPRCMSAPYECRMSASTVGSHTGIALMMAGVRGRGGGEAGTKA